MPFGPMDPSWVRDSFATFTEVRSISLRNQILTMDVSWLRQPAQRQLGGGLNV